MVADAELVDLDAIRSLLADWDEVRRIIVAGKLKGWSICFLDHKAREGVHLGGVYKKDRPAALRAAMLISMELNKEESIKPPEFKASRM